ncbi:MAG: hypothetical protein GX548_00060 [Lentisphaerae bacterium]|jgi:hypothetical protein|nr:hypothetical protein [Lentisphaerota bacterium]
MRACWLVLLLAGAMRAAGGPETAGPVPADPDLLEQVRLEFERAPDSSAVTRSLTRLLQARLPPDRAEWPPVFQAYDAALAGLAGKHARLPWDKYNRTRAGLAGLDALAAAHPESIEIRALRFFFCRGLPDLFQAGPTAEADLAALADLFARGADDSVAGDYRRKLRQALREAAPAGSEARRKLDAP